MCFSASASMTAGVLLTFVGVETIKKVHKPSQIVFGSIPLFFAAQQFSEGVIWLTAGNAGYAGVNGAFAYIFSFMAQALWPAMVPLSVLLLEQNRVRKRILYVLAGLGAAIGLFNTYFIAAHGIYAEVSSRHIIYQSDFHGNFNVPAMMLYLGATILPLFVSSVKRMYILGIIMTLSFAVSAVFYLQCLTSVWCFFAAVISFVVFYIIRSAHKQFQYDRIKI